ncbi:hypothetical protein [Rhizobium terrae]|uniref:hypothetical protein n=1 Tax=Rhizobium terrae TaxID=2171756 RepID=UPI000E3B85C6|nr:hypothetical protein [Rhizobium terrae]
MNQRVIITARRRLEAKIEELIGLLDLVDGDENLEPYLAGFDEFSLDDREVEDENDEDGGDAEPEETDQDGDEEDGDKSEDDTLQGGWFVMGKLEGGSGL